MKCIILKRSYFILSVALVLTIAGCRLLISPYSETAFKQATSLKAESLIIMDNATESYDMHREEIDRLNKKIEAAYEYAKGRPKNKITSKQWEILKDPDRNLLGGFLNRWENDGKLGKTFISEMRNLVSDAFNTIIDLESGKIKPKDVKGE